MNYSIISNDIFNIHYFNEDAKIVIVGISPGPTQNNYYCMNKNIKENNRNCSFAGQMRDNIKRMLKSLDKTGEFQKKIDIKFDNMWDSDFEKVNHTSILPFSVVQYDGYIPEVLNKPEEIECYKNDFDSRHRNRNFFISKITYNQIKKNKILKDNFNIFKDDFNKYNDGTIIIALGTSVINILDKCDELKKDNKLILRIPHASGANNGRINAFINGDENNIREYKMRQAAEQGIKEFLKR